MKKNVKIIKIIASILVIIGLICLTLRLYPIISKLGTIEGRTAFKLFISQYEILGVLILFLLNLLQMFLLILPGEPIEILFGLCYGWIFGTILNIISVLVNTYLIALLVKKFGKGFVYLFFKKENVDKLEKRLTNNKKRLSIIIFVIFFMPGTPKDLFIFISSLLPININKFVLLSSIARIPSILSSTLVGSSIIEGSFKNILLIYSLSFIIPIIIIYIISRKNKENYIDILK